MFLVSFFKQLKEIGKLVSQKKYLKLKSWLNFNASIVFFNKIKNLYQFSEKKFSKKKT